MKQIWRYMKQSALFDERELLIRNRVYKHGFIFLLLLLLADVLIRDYGHVDVRVAEAMETLGLYASSNYILDHLVSFVRGQWNLLIYIALAIALVFVEFAIRGVYLHRYDTPVARLTIMLLWMSSWAVRLSSDLSMLYFFGDTIWGDTIMAYGHITQRGALIITTCIALFVGSCIVVRAVVDIIRNCKNKEE